MSDIEAQQVKFDVWYEAVGWHYASGHKEDAFAIWQAAQRNALERVAATADYLDALEANMLRNDVDMRLDPCEAPSDVASALRGL